MAVSADNSWMASRTSGAVTPGASGLPNATDTR
jgi:hypothetical protein